MRLGEASASSQLTPGGGTTRPTLRAFEVGPVETLVCGVASVLFGVATVLTSSFDNGEPTRLPPDLLYAPGKAVSNLTARAFHLERYRALQIAVARRMHLAHPALADGLEPLVLLRARTLLDR